MAYRHISDELSGGILLYSARVFKNNKNYKKNSGVIHNLRLKSYLLAVCATFVAFILRWIVAEPLHNEVPFIFFFLAIMFSAWNGGFGAGLISTLLSVILSDYFFLPPLHAWTTTNDQGQLFQLGIFTVTGVIISYVCERFRREQSRWIRAREKYRATDLQAQANAERLRAITDALPSLVACINRDFRYEMVNDAYEKWFDVPRDEIIGKRVDEIIGSVNFEKIKDHLAKTFAGESVSFDVELVCLKSGRRRFVNGYYVPLKEGFDRIEHVIVLVSDISERRAHLEAVQKSETEFRTIFELAGSGKFEICVEQARFLRVNQKFCEIVGYTKSELLEMSLFDLLPRNELEFCGSAFQKAIEETQNEWACERQFCRKDGSFFWGEILGAFVRDKNEKALRFISTFHDVTSKKVAEKELAEAKERAEEASQTKSAFLANMSHEIRTPLGAMLGFAQLMLEDQKTTAEQKVQLQTILRNGELLYRIVNEVLDISKVEANKIEIEKVRFDLEEAIRDITSLLSVKAHEKGLNFEVVSEGPLPETIVSDPIRFRQILVNVIGNAIKFTDRGHVNVIFRLKNHDQSTGETPHLEITVKDTGPGIPVEKRGLLFQPFTQANSATSRRHGGTGLGLYLSKRLTQFLGGDLILDKCEHNDGCSFVITVDTGSLEKKPSLVFNLNNEHVIKGDFKPPTYERLDGVKVLAVDDSPDNLQLTKMFLAASGAQVECVLNAEKAFDLLKGSVFDVIIMDIQMPGMDGYEAVKKLRNENYTKPIIALTAHAMKGEKERCLEAGFDGYLIKPINKSALIQTVKSYAARLAG